MEKNVKKHQKIFVRNFYLFVFIFQIFERFRLYYVYLYEYIKYRLTQFRGKLLLWKRN